MLHNCSALSNYCLFSPLSLVKSTLGSFSQLSFLVQVSRVISNLSGLMFAELERNSIVCYSIEIIDR